MKTKQYIKSKIKVCQQREKNKKLHSNDYYKKCKIKEKRCSKCKEIKPINEFCRNKPLNDGFNNYCKECSCNHSKKYSEKFRNGNDYYKVKEKWRLKNKNKMEKYQKKYNKKYRDEHDEEIKKRMRNYNKDNVTEINCIKYNLNTAPEELKPIIKLALVSKKLNRNIRKLKKGEKIK